MNRENFEKLLRANREAPAELFDMGVFAGAPTACGTPACLFGNYALRKDLQSAFVAVPGNVLCGMGYVASTETGRPTWSDGSEVCEHFDISNGEANRLFGHNGCNDAGTDREKALAYVEHFLATGETPPRCCGCEECE